MALLHEYLNKDLVLNSYEKAISKEIWQNTWGVHDAVGQIKKVLVHRPGVEIGRLAKADYDKEAGALIIKDSRGRVISYCKGATPPDLLLMKKQHDEMTAALKSEGAEVIFLDNQETTWTNRLFTRDVALITPNGAILSRLSSYFRQGEIPIIQKTLANLGMPILGTIQGEGMAEGGSFIVLDEKTAIIGRSVRVNQAGIEQVRYLLSLQGIELFVIDIPVDKIHLDEVFLMLDIKKALVDTGAVPHWFVQILHEKGIQIIEVDPEDPLLTNNCLAVAPGCVLFPAKGKRTAKKIRENGIRVIEVDVSEINKMGGGIHCATLPLIRD